MSPRVHRVIVPVPEAGWLSIAWPRRSELVDEWIQTTVRSADAAGLPALRTVAVRATVRLSLASMGAGRRIHVAEDVRPSLTAALTGLVAAGALKSADRRHVVTSVMSMGAHTGANGGLLVLELTEVG